jgi:hypothetical protein
VGRSGRSSVHIRHGCFDKRVDGRFVAVGGRLRDVMRPNGGSGPARDQRGGGSGVRGESPAAADSLVYQASEQRMSVADAAGPQWTKQVTLGEPVRRGQFDQSGPDRPVHPVALDIDGIQDILGVHRGQTVAREDPERDVPLELAGPSGHHGDAAVPGQRRVLGRQAGLANAGLAGHADELGGAETGGEQLASQQIHFAPTANERRPDHHANNAIGDRPLWYRRKE